MALKHELDDEIKYRSLLAVGEADDFRKNLTSAFSMKIPFVLSFDYSVRWGSEGYGRSWTAICLFGAKIYTIKSSNFIT